MSCTEDDTPAEPPKKPKKKLPKCCLKDVKEKPKPKPARKSPAMPKPVVCPPIEKPPEKPKVDKPGCDQPPNYRSVADQRAYLEKEVVPILMEGMLALARDLPKDPISYLEKFWLQEQHKCDIPLPKDLL